jgi:hypothetical protein
MRIHMIEVEILSLYSKSFENIQYYFIRNKDLLLQLKVCRVGKSKEEERMLLTIFSRLGLDYLGFFILSMLKG